MHHVRRYSSRGVNVTPLSAPPVYLTNDVDLPQVQKMTIERDSSGKITGADVRRDGK
jgi:hypothetical protein